jgi:hypothetical protein
MSKLRENYPERTIQIKFYVKDCIVLAHTHLDHEQHMQLRRDYELGKVVHRAIVTRTDGKRMVIQTCIPTHSTVVPPELLENCFNNIRLMMAEDRTPPVFSKEALKDVADANASDSP